MRAIEIEKLSWCEKSKPLLEEVTLSLEFGESLGLLGPNGSGKSTLLRIIAGVIDDLSSYPRSVLESVRISGQSLAQLGSENLSSQIAYLGGELNSEFPIQVSQVIEIASSSQEAADRAIQEFGIRPWITRTLHSLSSGERQLVALARARAQGVRIWLLDEALVKLDLHHRALVLDRLKQLREQGHAFVLVSHDLSWIESFCPTSAWLRSGRIQTLGPTPQMLSADQIRSIYAER